VGVPEEPSDRQLWRLIGRGEARQDAVGGEPADREEVRERLEALIACLDALARELHELRARVELEEGLPDRLEGRLLDLKSVERRLGAISAGVRLVLAPGEDASASLLYNRALAALRAGRYREAEAAAERAAARGGREVAALASFLRGNIAFAAAERAERQAGTAGAEPFALQIAIAYAKSARDHWIAAATSRADWPEARRNVARALQTIEDLVDRKREAEKKKVPEPEPKPAPLPEPGAEREEVEPEPGKEPQIRELSPEQVLRLFERLEEKEREKVEVRRGHREERMAGVERDW